MPIQMTMPSGTITYEEAQDVIEIIAENKARQFGNIAWYEADDIKQEVRLKCSRTLHRFDASIGADLYTFLSKCADNRLRDIRRSISYKHNKPCFRCPLWDKKAYDAGEHDCLEFRDKMDCEKYASHQNYVHIKLSASRPVNIDENRVLDKSYGCGVNHFDLIEYINAHLYGALKELFDFFVQANFNLKALKPKDRAVLCEALVDILEIYQEEIEDD